MSSIFIDSSSPIRGQTRRAIRVERNGSLRDAPRGATTWQKDKSKTSSSREHMRASIEALESIFTSKNGKIVDAGADEASIRVQALETRQQLGAHKVSIVNQNTQLIAELLQ